MERKIGSVVWNWRDDRGAKARARIEARARRRGLIQAGVVLAVAAAFRFLLHRKLPADVLFVAGVLLLLAALWRPLLLQPLHRFGQAAGKAAGVGLAWLLLVPFYFACVVPGGLILRLRGSDPLARKPLPAGLTGWIPRRLEPAATALTRQFLDEDRKARRLERPECPPSERAWITPSGDGARERP
ncbi:hypothetical protein FJ250_02785 [bacterium]|nr:hypothetical protein [bacterium]